MSDSKAVSATAIFRHRPFALFWLARVATTVAQHMQAVAVAWQVYSLTDSPFDLGLVGLAQFLPSILLVLVVGQAADRYDRRTIIALANAAKAIAAAVLMLGSLGDWLTRDWILAMVVLFGGARAFEQTTSQSLLPDVVPQGMLSRAVAGQSSAIQTATIVGPALGGILYTVSGVFAYATCLVMFVAGAVFMLLIRIAPVRTKREPVSAAHLFGGIGFIARNRLVLGVMSLDMFSTLLGGAVGLLPIYARDIFQSGPWTLGILRTAPAIGALLTSVVLSRWHITQRSGFIMFCAFASFGLATMVFAVSTSWPLTLVALAAVGAADVISVVVRLTILQLATPDDLRGRVLAVSTVFVGASNQIGDFRAGTMASLIGTVPAVLFGGIGTIVVVLAWIRLFPQLFRIDRLEEARAPAAAPSG